MSTGVTPSSQGLPAEQVYEIQTMAEGGQFADALIRLRKIKAQYPQTTFFVALEKQLERLLVLPRDTDPTEAQKKELLDSLPGLIQGAVQAMRSGPPARPVPPPAPPRPAPDRVDREAARTQLKEQYFQHADEYLKKGAYGSALVEIRRVKIIAPDDKTALEYERTIRQLVELQQRAGIAATTEESPTIPMPAVHVEERIINVPEVDTQWVPAPSIPAPAGHVHAGPESVQEKAGIVAAAAPARTSAGGKKWWLFAVILAALVGGTGLVTILSAADDRAASPSTDQQQTEQKAQEAQAVPTGQPVQPAATGETGSAHQDSDIAGEKTQDPAPSQLNAPPPQASQSTPAVKPAQDPVVKDPAPAELPAVKEAVRPDSDPRITSLVQPVFTPEQKAMPSGEVVVMVQIDMDGKPLKTMVAKSTNPSFNQPIVTAILRSTFAPGMTASAPAVKWLTMPFRVN